MRQKHKLHNVLDKGTASDPIPRFPPTNRRDMGSRVEVACSPKPDEAVGPAGSQTKKDHKRLEQEVGDALDRLTDPSRPTDAA
jgi:hypothetical protein